MFEDVPTWVADYIGIPFLEKGRSHTGCDCWGLVRLVYLEHYGINLPLYLDGYESSRDGSTISALIKKEAVKWHEVAEPNPGDFIVCKITGRPWHIGLLVATGIMLHTETGIESSLAETSSWRWKNRIEGYYRYHE